MPALRQPYLDPAAAALLAAQPAPRKALFLDRDGVLWAGAETGNLDGNPEPFASTDHQQFLIRASGGVGIGLNQPRAPLHVVGGADVTPGGGGTLGLGAVDGANLARDVSERSALGRHRLETVCSTPAGAHYSIANAWTLRWLG